MAVSRAAWTGDHRPGDVVESLRGDVARSRAAPGGPRLAGPRRGAGMARLEGFEPPTNGFGSHYSIRLSYRRVVFRTCARRRLGRCRRSGRVAGAVARRSEEHTSELQSRENLV